MKEDKLDKIIALLEKGVSLQNEALSLSRSAQKKIDESMMRTKEVQESYMKYGHVLLRWWRPITVFVIVIVLFLLFLIIMPLLSTFFFQTSY